MFTAPFSISSSSVVKIIAFGVNSDPGMVTSGYVFLHKRLNSKAVTWYTACNKDDGNYELLPTRAEIWKKLVL